MRDADREGREDGHRARAVESRDAVNKETHDRCEDAGENPSEFPPCFRTLPALLVEEEMLRFTCPAGVALMVVQTGTGAIARRLVRTINAGSRFIVIRPLMVVASEADR